MENENTAPGYYIWGADSAAYGPVELPALVNWIKEERVVAETWVFSELGNGWSKASAIPELKLFFQRRKTSGDGAEVHEDLAALGIKPGSLRRIKIFAEMDDDQLNQFLKFIEIVTVGPTTHVVRKGEAGGAMYLVLEGELRSCIIVDGIESPLATLPPGSIFGEISLLDRGAHAADVISNQESVVIRISAEAFDKVIREAPELALPFLWCLSKSIAGRVRTLTKRYEDSVHLSHAAEEKDPAPEILERLESLRERARPAAFKRLAP